MDTGYIIKNKEAWNQRVEAHFFSDFYNVEGFVAGDSSLIGIEKGLLGEIHGKTILHLQCHFGLDTLSLARMGAFTTGVDLSDSAILKAGELAKKVGLEARFIQSDIYDLPNHLDEKFDIVFASYGTIGWLPDLEKWADVVQHFLKPGGRFVFVEFHPVMYMLDDDYKNIGYSYFNTGAMEFTEQVTYTGNKLSDPQTYNWWNHSLADVLNNLILKGLSLKSFEEYDYSPYNCFPNMVEDEPGKFRFLNLEKKIPLLYSLVAEKK